MLYQPSVYTEMQFVDRLFLEAVNNPIFMGKNEYGKLFNDFRMLWFYLNDDRYKF